MDITITTAHNVEIDYNVASLGDRVLANIVDVVIQGAYYLLVLSAVTGFLSTLDTGAEVLIPLLVILWVAPLLYPLLCEVFLNGQTFGKKAMSTRVVKLDGTQPTLGNYLLRWLLLPIDGFFLLGLLVLAVNGRGQRLGDLAAGTTVIKVRSRMRLLEAMLPEVEDEYTPAYLQVERLSDRDIAIAREVLADKRGPSRNAATKALAERLAEVLGLEAELAATTPDQFVRTILTDYTYLTRL